MSTTFPRRILGRQLRQLRNRSSLNQETAAKKVDLSRATLVRLEAGDETVRIKPLVIAEMLRIYAADDKAREQVNTLVTEILESNGTGKGWWHDYTKTAMPEWLAPLIAFEDVAEKIAEYQAELVPGLLQTRSYAEVVTGLLASADEDPEARDRRATFRMQRQQLLSKGRAPRLDVILNEAVLRRPVGGPAVMREQLRHLIDITKRANVTVRLVPFDLGVHGGMAGSSFTLLDFPADPTTGEPLEPPMAYAESLTGAMYLNRPEQIHAYRLVWADLETRALDQPRSRQLITEAMEDSGG